MQQTPYKAMKKMKATSLLSHLVGIHITNKILQILCFLATDLNYS